MILVVCSRTSMGAIFVRLDVASGIWVDLCRGCDQLCPVARPRWRLPEDGKLVERERFRVPARWIGSLSSVHRTHYKKNPIGGRLLFAYHFKLRGLGQ